MPLADVNLADLDNFTDGITPWRMFHTLRHQDPVHWQPEEAPNSGFWAVTRHADIARVDRDAETFTSTKFVNLEEVDDDQIKTRASILELDGVRHRALRSLLQRQFGASVINSYTDFLRGLTATTLDAALAKGTFDFVKEVSADFPINVLARLLDVPPEDNQQLIDWGNRIIGNTDPDYADVLLDSAESEQYRHLPFRSPASLEVFEYGRELARQRRGGDGTDLVSKLVNTTPKDGVPLSSQDFDNYFLLLVVAGNETTRHTITHSMLALLQHPDQLARLKDDPSLIPGAVEEFLRWASPVYHFRRTATQDVELGGKRIKEGDKVVMWYASGNRDEAAFGNPYDLDVTRADNDHVTFGKGSPHLCLGNLLARTEIRIMFEELIPQHRRHPPRRRCPARPLQLRQRHQEAAGRSHPRLIAAAHPHGGSRRWARAQGPAPHVCCQANSVSRIATMTDFRLAKPCSTAARSRLSRRFASLSASVSWWLRVALRPVMITGWSSGSSSRPTKSEIGQGSETGLAQVSGDLVVAGGGDLAGPARLRRRDPDHVALLVGQREKQQAMGLVFAAVVLPVVLPVRRRVRMRVPPSRTTTPPARAIFFSARSRRGARANSRRITSITQRRTVEAETALPPAMSARRWS